MKKIEKKIEKQVNIIVDRYLSLNISIKEVKKYLTGKNFSLLIDELSDLEEEYIRSTGKNASDFRLVVKNILIDALKDRKYAALDKTNESIVRNFTDFVSFSS